MTQGVFSLKSRFALGNVLIGLLLIALGIARIISPNHLLTLGIAVCLLVLTTLSLFVCLSPHREVSDEMSESHDGQAAGHAFRVMLIAMGLVCATCMATNAKVDFAGAGLGLIGLGLLVYGGIFGWLES